MWVEPERKPDRQARHRPPPVVWEEPGDGPVGATTAWVVAVGWALVLIFVIALGVWTYIFVRGSSEMKDITEPDTPATRPNLRGETAGFTTSRPIAVVNYPRINNTTTVSEAIALLGAPTDECDADIIDRYFGGPLRADPSSRLLAGSDGQSYPLLAVFVHGVNDGKALAEYGPLPRCVQTQGLIGRDRPGTVLNPEPPDEMLVHLRRLMD